MVALVLKVQLAFFMFIQYFIWGAWYVSMGTYLGKTLNFPGAEIGLAYGAFAIGSMISPFFVGLIADRYFPSQVILGVLGIVGGILLLALSQVTDFATFYPLLIVYCATYAPTLALGNSLSLTHLPNPKKDFPLVKTLSAVGWIGGGVTLSLVLQGESSSSQFILAAGASFALGIYSFFLPHTPPQKTGSHVRVSEILGLDALALMKKPSFAVFIVCMFLICIPLYFYFVNMNMYVTELQWTYTAAKMSLAQVSDVLFLVLLPLMLSRLGFRTTIMLGIFAWMARYFLLAGSVDAGTLATPMIFGAIILHGVCYDFLFIAGQLYVDGEANERNRGAAQGFIAFILWGVGNFVGSTLAGNVQGKYTLAEAQGTIAHDWHSIWLIPAWGTVLVMVLFMVFFRNPKR